MAQGDEAAQALLRWRRHGFHGDRLFRLLQMLVNGGSLDGVRLLSPMTVRWALADQIGTMRGVSHPGDGYSWSLVNPVRVADGGPTFPGSIGDAFWGGITGPRYFFDRTERLIGIVFVQ